MQLLKIIFGWSPQKHLSDTAWLTGVRGLAAFLVMMSHYSLAWLSTFAEAPFGSTVLKDTALSNVWYYREGHRFWAPWRLPIIRVFMCNGGGQVALFFIISGFVLTSSPLRLAQSSDYDKLYQSLGSATFRRWSRLYLPCGLVTIFSLLNEDFRNWTGMVTFLQSLWSYLNNFQIWANPFRTPDEELFAVMQGYNLVVWTIPHEFSGSIFVFALTLALGRMPYARRIFVTMAITLYAFVSLKWDLWLFGTGMILADYTRQTKGYQPGKLLIAVWTFVLLTGLTMLSYSSWGEAYARPGYDFLARIPLPAGWRQHVGEERFFWGCGATFILLAGCHLRLFRRFFETRVMQHLGKISFMLYLIHLLIGNVVGGPLQDAIYARACTYVDDPAYGIQVCQISDALHVVIVASLWCIVVPVVLIVAHILEVFVDRPVTILGRKVDAALVHGWSRGRPKAPDAEQAAAMPTVTEGEHVVVEDAQHPTAPQTSTKKSADVTIQEVPSP